MRAVSIGLAVFAAVLAAAVLDMLKDEARGWIERTPYLMLRLARRRLPPEQRQRLHDQEWLPELERVCGMLDAVPLTRLVVGTRLAFQLARSAPIGLRSPGEAAPSAVPMRALLIAGGAAVVVSMVSAFGVFGVYAGAAISLLGGVVVVCIVALVIEATTPEREAGRDRHPWL